jgi:hypothetical protein
MPLEKTKPTEAAATAIVGNIEGSGERSTRGAYTIPEWRRFQHYKQRCPPWIKLERSLLDDANFACLPVESRALLPMLWLLASVTDDGSLPAVDKVAWRLRLSVRDLTNALDPLIEAGFVACVQDASASLAACKREARLEERKEEAKDREEVKESETHAREGKPFESDHIDVTAVVQEDPVARAWVSASVSENFAPTSLDDMRGYLRATAAPDGVESILLAGQCAYLVEVAKAVPAEPGDRPPMEAAPDSEPHWAQRPQPRSLVEIESDIPPGSPPIDWAKACEATWEEKRGGHNRFIYDLAPALRKYGQERLLSAWSRYLDSFPSDAKFVGSPQDFASKAGLWCAPPTKATAIDETRRLLAEEGMILGGAA